MSRLQEEDINANFNGWLFEQTDYSGMFINPTEQAILDELERLVRSKQAGAGLVRRMPGVIPQLLQSLRSENFSGAELSRKISNDIVLVAEVIRLANSALSSSSETIASIQHAILVLGQGGLRQLITGVAFRPIIDIRSGRATSLAAPRIWYQSELCALACHQLARDEGLNVFEAFLAGLIQNVGLIVSLRIVDQIAGVDQAVGSASFCNALVSYARTLSCSIGREWNFPEDVIRAVEEQA
ncbi:MAG: HDOD domain-containing protein, partial [Herminiimonas sp.]|nr:HDOD domain-containing protein [Herminiimonas sp.]